MNRRIFLLVAVICLGPGARAEARAGAGPWHVVDDHAPSLVEISILLYGTPERWPEIARINGIDDPRRLRPGQKLILAEQPSQEPARGRTLVLDYWRARLSGAAAPDGAALESAPLRAALLEQVRTPEETRSLSAASLLESGRTEQALRGFREQRRARPEILSNWFYELQCLRKLGRESELQGTLRELLSARPELSALPAIKTYLKNKAP